MIPFKKIFFTIFLFFSITSFAQPVISSFSPSSGPVGTTVIITGSNFSSTIADNIVYFGVVRAGVVSATATSLTVTVPAGATYQPVSVTTGNLTAYSAKPFIVTFSGAAPQFSSQSFAYAGRVDSTDSNTETTKYTLADIDNDNKIDIITIDRLKNTLSVYRNTSTGGIISFATKVDFATGQSPRAVSAGDIDGDGKLDLVVSNLTDNTVSVFKNTSSGTTISFAPKVDFATSTQPSVIAITDIDKDGRPDLVVNTISLGGNISVLANTSSGGTISFAPKIDLVAGGESIEEIKTADIDGDGKQDIVLPNYGFSDVTILRNVSTPGNISFASPVNISADGYTEQVEIGDLNDDGKPDLVVSYYLTGKIVSVFRNTGSAGTISFDNPVDYPVSNFTDGLVINDLDGDGKPDVGVSTGIDSVSLFKNTSVSGGLISFDTPVNFASPLYDPVRSGDFDNDGKPDLAFRSGIFRVTIWKNRTASPQIFSFSPDSAASGTTVTINGVNFSNITSVLFGGVPAASFTVVNSTTITAVVDTGASGDIVLKAVNDSASKPGFVYIIPPVITSFSPINGTFGTTVTITGHNFIGTTAVSFGGLPADVFSIQSSTTITAVVGDAASGFVKVTTPEGSDSLQGFIYNVPVPPSVISFYPATGPVGTVVTISGNNFNTDTALNYVYFGPAKAKIISASANALQVKVPAGAAYGSISVTTGYLTGFSGTPFIPTFTGGGDISPGSFSDFMSIETGASPEDVCITDFDGDGKNDLGIVQAQRSGISILHNTSDSATISFDPRMDFSGFSPYGLVESADINGDGKKDIIVAGSYSNTLSVFKNTSTVGSINFTARTDYYEANFYSNVTALTTGDMDNDGRTDILIAGYNNVSVIRNISSPSAIRLAPMVGINIGQWIKAVKTGDMDGDGKTDIVLVSDDRDSVFVLRNISNGANLSFAQAVGFPLLQDNSGFIGSYDLCIGDMDMDGKTDLIATSKSSGQIISVLKNSSVPGNLYFQLQTEIATGDVQPVSINTEDLDGDGRPDLTYNNGNLWRTVGAVKNNTSTGSVSFASPLTFPFTNSGAPSGLCTGDLNNDGRPEIICASGVIYSPGEIFIFRNKTNGPHITSFSPKYAISDSIVTITGSNFTNVTNVSFAGVAAKSFSVLSPTKITAVIDSGASGEIDITTALGSTTMAGFIYGLPPVITSFNPVNAATNDYVKIKGKNLSWISDVKFGNISSASVAIDSDTSITAVVGGGASGYIKVIGNAGTDSLLGFNYIPLPVINSFSPAGAATGIPVTITGIHLSEATEVKFGGQAAASFIVNSDSSITAIPGNGASGDITIISLGGTATASGFTFFAPPIINGFSPISAATGNLVIIYGENFAGTTEVKFGGVSASSFTITPNNFGINAVVANGASGSITVTNPAATSSRDGFTFIPPPAISLFLPTSGGTGTIITITGTNFSGATQVNFGGTPASSFTVLNDTTITAVVGSGSSGSITITTPGGTISMNGFIYNIVTAVGDPGNVNSPELTVNPNPGSTEIDIKHPSLPKTALLRIIDELGRPVRLISIARNTKHITIDIRGLKAGIYVITWTEGNRILQREFLKQ